MPKILIADPIATEGTDYLKSRPGFDIYCHYGLDEAALCEAVQGCEALIVRSVPKVSAKVLAAASRLKVIGRAGIGVDNVDVEAATERGVVVLNTPDANATTTAELTIAHLLSLSRHLPQADRSVRAGEWKRAQFMGTEVAHKTLGIIGFGTIARIVAARAQGLKMNVIAYDPFVTAAVMAEHGVDCCPLEELLQQSDYLTLHCPLLEKTRHIIGAKQLALLKPEARLINCARGGLVDEAALLQALQSGQLAGAALDVYEHEPPKDSPLLALDNVVFTPHLGASTAEAQVAVGLAIAKQVAAYLESGEAINAINLPRVSATELSQIKPYQKLAERLGRLLAALLEQPLQRLEVALYGQAASREIHPIAVEALVGLLQEQLDGPVNSVNAVRLAKQQGIMLVESRIEETHDYLSLITLTGQAVNGAIAVTGTLLGKQYPRLARIDDHRIETALEGHLLITRHADRPGVVGALGNLLGQEDINISRMQVGVGGTDPEAMAVIEISRPLDNEQLARVKSIAPIHQVFQVSL